MKGEVRDLWIEDGRIIATPTDPSQKADKTIDAAGMVVMPGGVDMHCHIAGPKVNVARKMMPDNKRTAAPVLRTPITRSGTIGSVPSTFATGYKYAGMGYTTAFDAAIPPLAARHVHEELHDTPIIDKGFYVLMGNNHYVMQASARGGARAAEGLRRLAAQRGQGLRGEARQSGGRGSVEGDRRQRHRNRRRRRAFQRHAAADHTRRLASRDRAGLAASGAYSLRTISAFPETGRRR